MPRVSKHKRSLRANAFKARTVKAVAPSSVTPDCAASTTMSSSGSGIAESVKLRSRAPVNYVASPGASSVGASTPECSPLHTRTGVQSFASTPQQMASESFCSFADGSDTFMSPIHTRAGTTAGLFTTPRSSTSKPSLDPLPTVAKCEVFDGPEHRVGCGLLDIDLLDDFVRELRCKCGGSLTVRGTKNRRGLAFTRLYQCKKCQTVKQLRSSRRLPGKGGSSEVNVRWVLGNMLSKNYRAEANRISGITGFGTLSPKAWGNIERKISASNRELLDEVTLPANIALVKAWAKSEDYPMIDGYQDINAVAADGSWLRATAQRNSDTGHVTLVHPQLNLLLGYGTASKRCTVCESSSRRGLIPTEHACTLNFIGSSGSMEPTLISTAVVNLAARHKVNFHMMALDGDATNYKAINKEHVREALKSDFITRALDSNHTFKNVNKEYPKHKFSQMKSKRDIRLGRAHVRWARRVFIEHYGKDGCGYDACIDLAVNAVRHYAHDHPNPICTRFDCPFNKDQKYVPPEFGAWPLRGVKDIEAEKKEYEMFLRKNLPKSTIEDVLRAERGGLHTQCCEWRNGHVYHFTLDKKAHPGACHSISGRVALGLHHGEMGQEQLIDMLFDDMGIQMDNITRGHLCNVTRLADKAREWNTSMRAKSIRARHKRRAYAKNRKPDGQRNDYGGHGKYLHATMNDVLMSDAADVKIPDTGRTITIAELVTTHNEHDSIHNIFVFTEEEHNR